MTALSPRQAQVLSMHTDGRLTSEAIAAELGLHPGTVASHLWYAKQKVKQAALQGAEQAAAAAQGSVEIDDDYFGVVNDGPKLEPREQEILQLLAAGLTRAQICAQLGITAGPVRRHIARACRRLGAASEGHAVAIAMRTGVIA